MLIKVQGAAELSGGYYYEYDNESLPLGQGGMGIVYQGRCWRENDNSQYIPVAIKKITSPDQNLIERAMREASIKIDNDNLLRMYGFVPNMELDPYTNTQKPQYYVVMELLQGVNLDNVITGVCYDKSGLECPPARDLYKLYVSDREQFFYKVMMSILNGIKALHDQGYIHRDIDPSNAMVTSDGKIKLIDFGISKTVTAMSQNTSKLTSAGSIIGKVDYAAPEIILGDVAHHGKTTDIYALGIMMYQLYVGSLPFIGDNPSVMKSQLAEEVPVHKISNPEIRAIVEKATRKEQSQRYQTVDELISDLSMAFLGGLPPHVRHDDPPHVEPHRPGSVQDFDSGTIPESGSAPSRQKIAGFELPVWVSALAGLAIGLIVGILVF